MKNERSNLEGLLWRKKVDKSLFEHASTPIPGWVSDMWEIMPLYKKVTSKKDKKSSIKITFNKKEYSGHLRSRHKRRKTPILELSFENKLTHELRRTFLMSYMRALEQGLTNDNNIEEKITFWEFLDIEYNKSTGTFVFSAHYTQKPYFPELFKQINESTLIDSLNDVVLKKNNRIRKSDWMKRTNLERQVEGQNVIYMLADTSEKLLYIGEAKSLKRRLSGKYKSIMNWDRFRYDILPDELAYHRVSIERMVIRMLAALLSNNKEIPHIDDFSDYRLVNEKIDK